MRVWPEYRSPYLNGVVGTFRRRSRALSHRGEFRAYTDADEQALLNREFLVIQYFPSRISELRITVWDDGEVALDVERIARKAYGQKGASCFGTPARMVNAPDVVAFFERVSHMLPILEWPQPETVGSLGRQIEAKLAETLGQLVKSVERRFRHVHLLEAAGGPPVQGTDQNEARANDQPSTTEGDHGPPLQDGDVE